MYSARLPALHAVVTHGGVPGRLDGGSDTADVQAKAAALPRFTAIHYATRNSIGTRGSQVGVRGRLDRDGVAALLEAEGTPSQ